MAGQTRVLRPMRRASWTAVSGTERVGTAQALMRPDRRWFIAIDTWHDEAFDELLAAVGADLCHPLYTTVAEDADHEAAPWLRAGFEVARREDLYDVPTDPAVTGLVDVPVPGGLALVAADEVDEAGLRDLDDRLRQDVPGTDGWFNEPDEFREYTFAERHFDPATYLVAVDAEREVFAGLVRVWIDAPPRLGLIAVLPGYRRNGLARALLGTVFDRLHRRGIDTVAAEVDRDNRASTALLTGIGAQRVGGTLELVRRPTGA